jgi:uncharacterized protein YcfJ
MKWKSAVLVAIVATAGVSIAGNRLWELAGAHPEYAQVIEATPVQKMIRTPRKECVTVDATERCETVYDTHIERLGYDVRYRVGSAERTVRMGHDPGERIPLREGRVVLDVRTGTG